MRGTMTSGTLSSTPCAIKLRCNLAQMTLIHDSVKIALYSRSSGTENRASEPEAKGRELICGPVHCKASVPVPSSPSPPPLLPPAGLHLTSPAVEGACITSFAGYVP